MINTQEIDQLCLIHNYQQVKRFWALQWWVECKRFRHFQGNAEYLPYIQYFDLLTFTAGATFSNFGGGVTAVGNQLIPSFGASDGQMADVAYLASTTGFTITHGNGPNNIDPGFLIFPNMNFDVVSVPEPGSLALLGIGLAGMGLARRRKKI